jgi:pyridoxamine 5'-phosphate oxidase
MLLTQFHQMKEKFAHGEIPLPDFWGGYLIKPQRIEFWQGGEHRLHDRFEYTRDEQDTWHTQRLMP